jgi:MATE family multidrug resistance protein
MIFNVALPKLYLDFDDVTNFQDNFQVVTIASKLMLIAAVFQISDAIQVVTLGALRGMQDVKIPTFITFIAYWVIGFPISYYLGMYTEYASSGIWIGLLAGLTASAVMLFIRFNYLSKQLVLSESNN